MRADRVLDREGMQPELYGGPATGTVPTGISNIGTLGIGLTSGNLCTGATPTLSLSATN